MTGHIRDRRSTAEPSLRIIDGRVIDPANGVDAVTDVFVRDGRIAGVGQPPEDFRAVRTIDASGRLVIPGVVDAWARLREPGETHKANIASETRAAVTAGVTRLACPPDTRPVIDSTAVIKLVQERAEAAALARVHPIGALTRELEGSQLSPVAALREAGCIALGQAGRPVTDTRVLRYAMEYAASQDMRIVLQPSDPWLAEGCAHEGPVASRLGLPAIPAAAETTALAHTLALVEATGVRVHFTNLSAGRSVEMIERARDRGLPVSASVSAHQLFLTEMDIDAFDADCHVLPPLRSERDRNLLRQGVADGIIEGIQSDHQPHEADAKLAPFPATEPGIAGLETLLPLTLKLADEGVLDLATAVAAITCGPARTLGLEAGTLTTGASADLCIVDPDAYWTFEREHMHSRGRNTPFHGWSFEHRVSHTFIDGQLVFEHAPGDP